MIIFMGRKPRLPGKKKTNVLRVLLAENDRAALDKAAEKAGLDTSTWVRVKILELIRKGSVK